MVVCHARAPHRVTSWVVWPLACFCVAVLAHGGIARLALSLDGVRRFVVVGIAIGVAMMIGLPRDAWMSVECVAAIGIYAALCELYIFSFTLVVSSISVSTLMDLRAGPASEAELLAAHDPRQMVRERIDGLIAVGWIVRDGRLLRISDRGRRVHRRFSRLRRLFGHPSPAEG